MRIGGIEGGIDGENDAGHQGVQVRIGQTIGAEIVEADATVAERVGDGVLEAELRLVGIARRGGVGDGEGGAVSCNVDAGDGGAWRVAELRA